MASKHSHDRTCSKFHVSKGRQKEDWLTHPPTSLPPSTLDSSLTSLISNTEILRCQWGSQWRYQLLSDYCKRFRGWQLGGGREALAPSLHSVLTSQITAFSLCLGVLAAPLPPEYLWLRTSPPARGVSSRRSFPPAWEER
jgi:hypothetical protein